MTETTHMPQIPSSRHKRRWMQFGLRAMFVWTAVIGALMAVTVRWIAPVQQQRAAVKMIERVGGEVYYAAPAGEAGWLGGHLRRWLPRCCFDPVQMVDLGRSSVTNDDLELLTRLPHLQWLILNDTRVTDAGLAHLRRLPELYDVYLDGTNVTDKGVAHLSTLPRLHGLSLLQTQISDAGLAHLGRLPQLQSLNLKNTGITDAGLAHLDRLPHLQVIWLKGTLVTEAAAQEYELARPKLTIVR